MAVTEQEFIDQHRRAHRHDGMLTETLDELTTIPTPSPASDEFPPVSRLEIISALYTVALASAPDLESAFAALEPYDRHRLADAFTVCAARYDET